MKSEYKGGGGSSSMVKSGSQNQPAQKPSMDFGAPHGRAMDNNAEAINKLVPPSGMPGNWTGASGKAGGK